MSGQPKNNIDQADQSLFGVLIALFFIAIFLYAMSILWKEPRLLLYKWYSNGIVGAFDSIGLKSLLPEAILNTHADLNIYYPSEMTVGDAMGYGSLVMPFFALPFLGILALIYFRKAQRKSYNRIFTRKDLINDQKVLWQWLYPLADLKLEPEIEKGDWAMAKRPLDYIKKYNLMDVDNQIIIQDKSKVILSTQLGRLFNDFENLRPIEQAFFVIFAIHSNLTKQDKKQAYTWNARLAISRSKGNIDYSWVKEAYEKVKDLPAVKRATSQHAYVNTVLMRLLEEARGGEGNGVFPTSYFNWIKHKDIARDLYLALNTLGRREAFIEVSGIFNHYLAEKVAKRPLLRPMVNQAILGLEKAVDKKTVLLTDHNFYDLDVE